MTIANPLRILLVEDDELFRLGLATRLQRESEFEVVAEASDGETAVEFTNQYLPDVVLLDIGLPLGELKPVVKSNNNILIYRF
jgi:DNA-binding NarL/FixJ family response regulator